MPIALLMPALSAGMEEGVIARWLKTAGDRVTAGETIAEIETDKATVEFAVETSGVISELIAVEGQPVPVNGVIARLVEDEERADGCPDCATSQQGASIASQVHSAPLIDINEHARPTIAA